MCYQRLGILRELLAGGAGNELRDNRLDALVARGESEKVWVAGGDEEEEGE